jgi:single-strand DNA-binding protein
MIIVQVAGRLGRDPESRFTSSGLKVTTLTVATNVRKGGKDETVWWRVTIWGERLDKMISHLKKGSAIIAIGEMHKPEIWTDKEGRPQVSMELTADILRFSPFGGNERPQQDQQQSGNFTSQFQQGNNNYGNDTGFGDFGTNPQSFGANTQSYGTPSYGTVGEQSMGMSTSPYTSTANDDQDVPF